MSMVEVGAVVDGRLFAGSATKDFGPPCIPGRRQWGPQESWVGEDGYDLACSLNHEASQLTNRQVVKVNTIRKNRHIEGKTHRWLSKWITLTGP